MDNIVVANQGLNPLVSYNYMLRIEGLFDLPCKAVHSFTKENEFEYIQEGGLNDYVHLRRKPVSKPFTFTVERYVGIDYFDPLQNGTELVLPVLLMVTRHANRFDVTKRTYVFTGCTVMSKEYGELNAEQSGLLTEKTVISYREMLVVDVPVDIGIGSWKFGKDKTEVEGNEKRFAQTFSLDQSIEEREKSLWKFNNKDVKGNEQQRGKTSVSTKPLVRDKFDIQKNTTISAKTIQPTKATVRQWSIKDGETNQSVKRLQETKAVVRQWPQIQSAKKRQ